jgi:hypothetical protein
VGGLEGQATRLHPFWPRGRQFDSRSAHFIKTLNLKTYLYFARDAFAFTQKVGKALALFNQKSSFNEAGFLPP